MAKKKSLIVTQYARLWPREVFNIKEGKSLPKELKNELSLPGVYVLYRDDEPYYIGKANILYKRIYYHANVSRARYFHLWNFFSAFVVPKKKYLSDIEGTLIASVPTQNSAIPRIKKLYIPKRIATILQNHRTIKIESKKQKRKRGLTILKRNKSSK